MMSAQWAQAMLTGAADVPEAFAAFDCETTGLDADRDELLALAAVATTPEGRREWHTLVNPGRPIDLQITRLTGIRTEQLGGAPTPAQALRTFRAFVGDLPLVAHNAGFDVGFVEAGLYRHRLPPLTAPVYDTLELARLVAPAAPSHRLEELVQTRGLRLDRAHDALADARAAGDLFAALLRELRAMDPPLLRTVAHFMARARGPLARLVVGVAGGGPPTLVKRSLPPVGGDDRPAATGAPPDLGTLLDPGSPLAERLQPFEVRPGQARMLQAVARAFASDRHLIVEAGTGTGKSLAYLLPALAWAVAQRERVVVATHTVNLQEQLVEKDLPAVTAAGIVPGRVALIKGRGQYACLKLWDERLQGELAPEDAPFHARFAAWLAQTETGDRSELGLYGEDEERFGALSTDAVACTGRRCPFYDPCFLFRARRQAERADVVVANYALLFADLATGGQVLPEYAYLVCDEAHHIEDQASSHLGRVVGERSVERFWRLLERGGGGGLLPALRTQYDSLGLIGGGVGRRAGEASPRIARAFSALHTAREGADAYFDGLRQWNAGRQGGSGAYARSTLRFEPRPSGGLVPDWDALRIAGERFMTGLSDLAGALESVAAGLDDGSSDAEPDAERILELRQTSGRAAELAADLGLMLEGRDGWVTWCEVAQTRGGGSGAAVVRACPIDPGDILRRDVFAAKRAVVMTSATLAVRGRFDYLRGRLGLAEGDERERTDELLVDSPFDFRSQALLGIPTDAPRPLPGDPGGYARAVAPLLVPLLIQSRGHALVLFTSNRVMREVRDRCKPELEAAGIACLAQGLDGSRGALTAALRRNEETVVLGSASFWEGVDVQGDALRCLVIAQLPFWPPDMPLQQARQEAIAARGGTPFRELQLPQAVLRFKQGFGRLIRSTSDRGVAVVLDPRLVTSDYGRSFLNSLPRPETVIGPAQKVLARTAQWLAAHAGPGGDASAQPPT